MTPKGMRKFSIKSKILTAFLGLSLVSHVMFGFIALKGITSLNSYFLRGSQALGIIVNNQEAVGALSGGQTQFNDITLRFMKITWAVF
jgi:hypothetical protein